MATKRMTRLIDSCSGLMECRNCKSRHWAQRKSGGMFKRGSWQCAHGCPPVRSEQPTPQSEATK